MFGKKIALSVLTLRLTDNYLRTIVSTLHLLLVSLILSVSIIACHQVTPNVLSSSSPALKQNISQSQNQASNKTSLECGNLAKEKEAGIMVIPEDEVSKVKIQLICQNYFTDLVIKNNSNDYKAVIVSPTDFSLSLESKSSAFIY